MNYDQQITDLNDAIKADKDIIQPWRNKAIARLEEARAFIRMGKTSAPVRKGDPLQNVPGPVSKQCICKYYGIAPLNPQCPIHGL